MAAGKKHSVKILSIILVLLALCCLTVGILLLLEKKGEEPEPVFSAEITIDQGISAAGIALEGMTQDQARQALAQVEQQMLHEIQFQLNAEAESITLTAADFNVTFDTERVLQNVLDESLARQEQRRTFEKENGGPSISLPPVDYPITCTVDVTPLRPRLETLKTQVDMLPVNASVEMDITVDGWFRYTQGQPGRELDVDALMATLRQRAEDHDFGEVNLPYLYTEPEITVEKLQSTLVKRSAAETSFAKKPYNRDDRVFNVKRAASLVNGFVLKPGEVFSTNDTLGPRTYELGWKPAPAYVRGATEDQAGGGVCQVSSTLYAAVAKADLEIVHRRNHSSTVGYIPRGLDATINTGTIDFQFKNNTQNDIYIFAYTIDAKDGPVPEDKEDKTVHVEIYGEPFPPEFDEIRLEAEKTETLKPSGDMEIVVDTTVAADYYNEDVQRKDGSRYQSYKIYYKGGEEVRKEKLAQSEYKAWNGKITVGVGYYSSIPVLPEGGA